MSESNYGDYAKYIVTGPKLNQPTPPLPRDAVTDMIYLDDEVIKGAWNVICAWFWPRKTPLTVIPESHFHGQNEVVTFFGSNPQDPFDLCGEVEFWMEDQKLTLTRSCLVYIPSKMRHSPLKFIRIDRPIFHFSSVTESRWVRQN